MSSLSNQKALSGSPVEKDVISYISWKKRYQGVQFKKALSENWIDEGVISQDDFVSS